MDFEHQPANHLAFRLATLVLLPEALPGAIARRQGATKRKVWRYPGLKEAIYLGDFEPDPDVLSELGLARSDERALVVARTPPARALYHRFGNPLFTEALRVVARQPHVQSVVLARHPEQVSELAEMNLPNCTIPSAAIDSRSLLYEADLVIGAGGTMTREAALMGVPTFTLFAGRAPAVDRWLEDEGPAEAAHRRRAAGRHRAPSSRAPPDRRAAKVRAGSAGCLRAGGAGRGRRELTAARGRRSRSAGALATRLRPAQPPTPSDRSANAL